MSLYLFLVALLSLHSVELTLGSWIGRLCYWPRRRNPARQRRPLLPAVEEPPAAVENFIHVGHPCRRRRRQMTRNESAAFRYVHTRITWLLTFLIKANSSTDRLLHNAGLCKSRVPGLDVVKSYLPLIPSEGRQFPKLGAAFPSRRPASVISALSGGLTSFRVREDVAMETLQDAYGEDHAVKYFFKLRSEQLTMTDAALVTSLVGSELRLNELFRVHSREAVECRFHLKTPKDVLLHPGQQACVTCPAGCVLNFFLLYSPAKATLSDLVASIDLHSNSPTVRNPATITALNVSLQLVNLVGQVRLKSLVLSSFSPEHIHVDESGTLALHPQFPPRPEAMLAFRTPWPQTEAGMNTRDTALTLMYIWCLEEVKAMFPSLSTVTVEEVNAAIRPPHCSPMPQAVRRLIADILNLNENLGEVIYSPSYEAVASLLRQELEAHNGGAVGT